MPQAFHECTKLLNVSGAICKLLEPFAKDYVQGFALGARNESCPLDEVFVRSESYALHICSRKGSTSSHSQSKLAMHGE
jgi:hypothetical protein